MQTQFIHLKDATKIAYTWVKPETQRTDVVVVFLHEALGSIGQWKGFPQLLCNTIGAKGLIYERQGYGLSSPLTQKRTSMYLEKYACEEMPQIIDLLLSNQKIVLIGHSDGGSIALLYASSFPNNVVGVITMAAHVFVEKETIEGIYPAIEAYSAGRLHGLHKYHGDKVDELFKAWSETWLSAEYQSWNICDKIAQQIPSLILQGDKDEYGTEKQLFAIQEKLSKAEIQLLPNIHHQPHLEQPELVSNLICEWLQKNIL